MVRLTVNTDFLILLKVDIIDGKASESDFDLSLVYESQLTKDSLKDDQRVADSLPVARREPEGKDNDSINTVNSANADPNKMVPLGKEKIFCQNLCPIQNFENSCDGLFLFSELPTETTYSTEDNGKINIHVSVTINASTLAELKKQRAQHRNSSPDMSLYPSYHQSIVPCIEGTDPEISTVKRFAGNTGDHLVADPRTTRCCVLL